VIVVRSPVTRRSLLGLWSRRRTTVVFVTHDVGEAAFLADRVVLLSARPGRVAREFTIDALRPRTRGDTGLLAYESEIYAALREPAGTHSCQ
jgi:NitT/TauT family transport system ATP-binding protein